MKCHKKVYHHDMTKSLPMSQKSQLNWHQTESTARYNVNRKLLLGHKNVTMTHAMGLGDKSVNKNFLLRDKQENFRYHDGLCKHKHIPAPPGVRLPHLFTGS